MSTAVGEAEIDLAATLQNLQRIDAEARAATRSTTAPANTRAACNQPPMQPPLCLQRAAVKEVGRRGVRWVDAALRRVRRLTLRLPIAYRRHIDPTSQLGCIAGEDWTSGSHLVSGRAKTVEVTESK